MLNEQQRAIRKKGIGASEIGAILGISPWKFPIDVWQEKVGEAIEISISHHIERGWFLEEAILKWYAHRTGRIVSFYGKDQITYVHKDKELCIATPDGASREPKGDIDTSNEVKAPSYPATKGFGDDGTDQIPDHYLAQVQWQMAASGMHKTDLIALINGDIRIYPIKYNHELFGVMYDEAEKFWRDHVLTGKPPAPDASESYDSYLRKTFPKSTETSYVESSTEIDRWASELQDAREALAHWEEQEQLAKNHIIAAIGNHAGIKGPWGSISFKSTKDSTTIDHKRLISSLEMTDDQLDVFRVTKPGHRRFLVNFKDGE